MSPKDTAAIFDTADKGEAPPSPKAKKARRRALMLSVPLALVLGGGWVWLHGGRYETTDNAYVRQAILPVSADVSGRIIEVVARENQEVHAGDVLFRIDDEPYRIALDQAEASLAAAQLGAEQLRSAWVTARGRLEAAEQVLDLRRRDYERQQELASRGVISNTALDDAQLTVQAAENEVTLAGLAVTQAASALGGDPERDPASLPSVRAAISAREGAERALAHTVIRAPADGIVSQTGSLNVGQYIGTGTMVASLVESGASWIEANFKETQIAALVPGQSVTIDVDAYDGAELHGTVDSLGAATGSQFSLIPAQNATGNWVKVVQRLPVRIRIDDAAAQILRGGLSATVAVDTGESRLDRMGLPQYLP